MLPTPKETPTRQNAPPVTDPLRIALDTRLFNAFITMHLLFYCTMRAVFRPLQNTAAGCGRTWSEEPSSACTSSGLPCSHGLIGARVNSTHIRPHIGQRRRLAHTRIMR